jgi:hypothetical protein
LRRCSLRRGFSFVRSLILVRGHGFRCRAAVFIEELLGGVVFCGDFQLFDRGVSLFLEGGEVGLSGGGAVVIKGCEGEADGVDAAVVRY